jgi:ribosomal protein S4E
MIEYFRVGNLVTIIAGQWKGNSGVIVSILPDRLGQDDLIQVRLDSGDSMKVPIRPRELQSAARSHSATGPGYRG